MPMPTGGDHTEPSVDTAADDLADTEPSADDLFTERVVDTLAAREGVSARWLAESLDVPVGRVRDELAILERLGCVIRRGNTRSTCWYLG